MKKVAIIMGSDSDFPVVQKAVKKLKEFDVPYEVHVMSAHRTPDKAIEFSANAKKNGFGVIIAAAGMAAHLAGVLAAKTTLPVIGIPCKSAQLDGMDALLATVMMPTGSDDTLAQKLEDMKLEMEKGVAEKDLAMQTKVAEL